MTQTQATLMVAHGQLPESLQLTLLHAYPDHLARNPSLSEQAWTALFANGKIPSDRAEYLVGRTLTTAQIDLVLSKGAGSRVLASLVRHNALSSQQLEVLLSQKHVPTSVLGDLPRYRWFDHALMGKLFPHLTGMPRLDALVERAGSITAAELAAELLEIDVWWGKDRSYAQRNQAIDALVQSVDGLLPLLAVPTAPAVLRTPIAGCSRLLDLAWQWAVLGFAKEPEHGEVSTSDQWAQIALIWNPVTHEQVLEHLAASPLDEVRNAVARRRETARTRIDRGFESLDDEDQIKWALNRSCSSENRFTGQRSKARPFDLCRLAMNPNLSDDQRRRVADQLGWWVRAQHPCLENPLQAAADHLGGDLSQLLDAREPAEISYLQTLPDPEITPASDYSDEAIEGMYTKNIGYAPAAAKAVEYALARLDEEQFQMLLTMVPRHKGRFGDLVATVKRLRV